MVLVVWFGGVRRGEGAEAPEVGLKESAVKLPPIASTASVAVSADLQRIAYLAQRDGGQCVVADGKAGKVYQEVYGLTVSPNGKHFAYAAVQNGVTMLVYDGVEKREVDGRIGIVFSPDDQRLAYTVFQPGAGQPPSKTGPHGKARVVIDGTEGRKYDWVGHATFSQDSKRVAYTAINDQRGVVVADGVEGQPFDSSFDRPGGYPAFRPNGKLAYAQQRRKRTVGSAIFRKAGMADDYAARAVIGPIEGKEYSEVHDFAFSLDGSRFGYVAARISGRERKERAVVDGLENKEYDEVRGLAFSPNGRKVAYVARRGEESIEIGRASCRERV
jgi:Tol biopolymer transport system component